MPGKVSGGIGPLVSGPPCRHQGRPAAKWGGPLTKWMNECKSVSRTRHRLNGTRKVLGGWSRTPRRAPETGHGTRTVDTVGTQGPSTTSCATTRRSSRIRIAHERSSKACIFSPSRHNRERTVRLRPNFNGSPQASAGCRGVRKHGDTDLRQSTCTVDICETRRADQPEYSRSARCADDP